jgi:hypothetical protein
VKRFTETTKWREPWFRRLSPAAKLLFLYLTDHCDCTGLIDLDFEAAAFDIGAKVEEKHLTELVDRVQRTVDGKVFLTRFIAFQQGTLSVNCPAHKPILKLIKERNLTSNGKGYQYPNETLPLGLSNPTGTSIVIVKNKEEGEVQEGKEKSSKSRCTQSEAESFAASLGLPRSDGTAMFLHWEERGWRNVKDWRLTMRKWKSFGYLPSQGKRRPGQPPRETHPKIDPSKTPVPERFKNWMGERYPDHRAEVEKWRSWADVPPSLRQEWSSEQRRGLYAVA